MVVKVDLKCEKCKKKIKEVLCKIPQIENQEYDGKNNAVNITVVCCSLEKIKKKIRCKGGRIILGIEILKPQDKAKEKPKENGKSKQESEKQKTPEPKQEKPPRDCCRECSEGHRSGPCYQGHVKPLPPCYYSYYGGYGWPMCDCWGSGCQRSYVICEENPTACTIM